VVFVKEGLKMNLSEKTELVFEFPVEFVAIKNLAV